MIQTHAYKVFVPPLPKIYQKLIEFGTIIEECAINFFWLYTVIHVTLDSRL